MGAIDQSAPPLAVEQPLAAAIASTAGSASASATVVNVVSANLGAGLLSLPWSMAGASLLVGVAVNLAVVLLNGLTIMIIVVAADRKRSFDLGDLIGKLPRPWGRPARALTDITIWVSVLITLVGYFRVVVDSISPFTPMMRIPPWCSQAFSLSLGVAACMPLCFLDQGRLAVSSSFSILANLFLLGVVLRAFMGADVAAVGDPCLLGTGLGPITTFSALMQAGLIQVCVLPMYEELERRSPRRFAICLALGLGFILVLFSAFSCAALFAFGVHVDSNILNSLPHDLMGDAARLAMAMSVLGCYPLFLNSLVAPLRHSEERAEAQHRAFMYPSPPSNASPTMSPCSPGWTLTPTPPGTQSYSLGVPLVTLEEPSSEPVDQPRRVPLRTAFGRRWRRVVSSWRQVKVLGVRTRVPLKTSHVATVLVVVCTAIFSSLVDNLGMVNVINGSFQVAALIGIVPGLIGLHFLGHGVRWKAFMIALMVFGVFMTVLGLALAHTGNFVSDLVCSWTVSDFARVQLFQRCIGMNG